MDNNSVSIVIRTYNEEKYLDELLSAIQLQNYNYEIEVVLVDSGSTDQTLEIAEKFDCRTVHIKKSDFTFGRSLNYGCDAANGEFLAFISGHCIPKDEYWIKNLVQPYKEGSIMMSYGRQIGVEETKFSEHQIFSKYFPDYDMVPQDGFFSNNANSSIRKIAWEKNQFDEELTGLEDMYWAKQMVEKGYKIAYKSDATVYHIHEETWRQVKLRYEREAIALQNIMPEVHLSFIDLCSYTFMGIFSDFAKALDEKKLHKNFLEIILFRICQYYGAYKGNHEHRKLSKKRKEKYFYPN